MAASNLDWLTVRMRLQNQAQVERGLVQTGAAVRTFGNEVQLAGKKSAFAAEKNFLLGESLYSLRRYGFYAITALGLTGAELFKLGLSFDSAKNDGITALTAITGSAREARAEVGRLINVTHQSGLGLGFLVDETKNMLAFGYSVRDTNRYLSIFSNFSGKKGLGEGGVSSLVQIFNRVRDTGFLDSREIKSLQGLGIPVDRTFGRALGLSPGQLFALQHGQIQLAAGSALPALSGYLNTYANKQPYRFSQLFSILKGDLSETLGGAEGGLFGGLRGRLTAGVAGYRKSGFGGLLQGLDPTGGLRAVFAAIGNTGRVVVGVLHALWTVGRPLVIAFAAVAGVVGLVASNLTAMKLILLPLIGLYLVDRAQKIYQLARDKIFATQTVTTTESLLGLSVAASRAAGALTLIGGARGGGIIGGTNTLGGAGGLASDAEKIATGGFLGRLLGRGRGLLGFAGKLRGPALLMAALNLSGAGGSNKYDNWNLNSLEHGFGLFKGSTWGSLFHQATGMAGGGKVTSSGWSWVGEHGPELMNVPRGAQVVPLDKSVGIDYMRLARAIVDAFHRSPIILEAQGTALAGVVSGQKLAFEARQ